MYQQLGDLFFSQRLGSFEDDASTIAAPNATPKQHTKHHRKWKTWSSKKGLKHLQKKMNRLLQRRDSLTKLRNNITNPDQKNKIDQELAKIAKILDKINAKHTDLTQKISSVNKSPNPVAPPIQVGKDQVVVSTPPTAPNLQGFGQTTTTTSSYSKVLIAGIILAIGAGAFFYYKKHKPIIAALRRRFK